MCRAPQEPRALDFSFTGLHREVYNSNWTAFFRECGVTWAYDDAHLSTLESHPYLRHSGGNEKSRCECKYATINRPTSFIDKLNGPRSHSHHCNPIFSASCKGSYAMRPIHPKYQPLAQDFFSCLVFYQCHPIAGCERAVVAWNSQSISFTAIATSDWSSQFQ